jgi:hypothetical protein
MALLQKRLDLPAALARRRRSAAPVTRRLAIDCPSRAFPGHVAADLSDGDIIVA